MRCITCGRGIADGAHLHRQNEKGVPGIWKCERCNMLPVDKGVQAVLDAIAPIKPVTKQ